MRAVIAEDVADILLLVRMMLSASDWFEIVGEAATGREAIDQTLVLQPE